MCLLLSIIPSLGICISFLSWCMHASLNREQISGAKSARTLILLGLGLVSYFFAIVLFEKMPLALLLYVFGSFLWFMAIFGSLKVKISKVGLFQNSVFAWLLVAVISGAMGLLGPYGMGDFLWAEQHFGRSRLCIHRQHNIVEALKAYAAKHHDCLPDEKHWVDDILPYLEDKASLHCPEDHSTHRCSYGFNKAFSGFQLTRDTYNAGGYIPVEKIIVYETSQSGQNPAGGINDVISRPRHSHYDDSWNDFTLLDGKFRSFNAQQLAQHKDLWDLDRKCNTSLPLHLSTVH